MRERVRKGEREGGMDVYVPRERGGRERKTDTEREGERESERENENDRVEGQDE